MATARKTGGAKTSRSETVTVRLDPKLRYLAELAARGQRRTLSSFIEWAIEKSLDPKILGPEFYSSINGSFDSLWDVDEADRFLKLAFNAPFLLTYEEQVVWKVIKDNGYFWIGHWDKGIWFWSTTEGNLLHTLVRYHWDVIKQVASGKLDVSALPKVTKENCFEDPNHIPF